LGQTNDCITQFISVHSLDAKVYSAVQAGISSGVHTARLDGGLHRQNQNNVVSDLTRKRGNRFNAKGRIMLLQYLVAMAVLNFEQDGLYRKSTEVIGFGGCPAVTCTDKALSNGR
jgi:hypothetical protein